MFILSLAALLLTTHMLLSYPARRLQRAANDREDGSSIKVLLILFVSLSAVIALSAPILPFVLALRQIHAAGLSLATLLFSNFAFVRDIAISAIIGAVMLLYLNYAYPRLYKVAVKKQTLVEGVFNTFLAPFVEEVIFRGYGRMYCDAQHISSPIAALLTAGLFAVPHLHLGGVLTTPSFRSALWNLIQDTVFGIVLYYLYLTTDSLMVPIISHFAANAAYFYVGRKQVKQGR